MSLSLLGLLYLTKSPKMAADLVVTQVKVTTSTGEEKKFGFGEGPFFLQTTVRCNGGSGEPFQIVYQVAGAIKIQQSPSFVATPGKIWTVMWSPGTNVDYGLEYAVRAVPVGAPVESGKPNMGVIEAVLPDKFERIDPIKYRLENKFKVTIRQGVAKRLEIAMPIQDRFSHQEPETPSTKDSDGLVKDSAGPGEYDVIRNQVVVAYNIRLNPKKLEAVTWSNYSALPPEAKQYNVVPGEAADIAVTKEFVDRHLQPNFRQTMTPMKAAQTLFRGLVKDFSYQIPEPPTFVEVCKAKKATCFGFSSLYARAISSIGIPSRVVLGVDLRNSRPQNHAWVEIFVPGTGWLPQDPTFSDGVDKEGYHPYFFYIVPRLNERVATGYLAPWSKDGISGMYGSTASYRMTYSDTPPQASAVTSSNITKL